MWGREAAKLHRCHAYSWYEAVTSSGLFSLLCYNHGLDQAPI